MRYMRYICRMSEIEIEFDAWWKEQHPEVAASADNFDDPHAAIHAILCQVRRAESAEQELQKARVLMTRLVTLSILGASRWPRVLIDLAATYRAFLATEGKEGTNG
jgi:hypothetical protein